MNEQQKNMLLDWMRKVHQLEYAHRYESLFWGKVHFWVGLSAFALSLFIAFSFRFPSVEPEEYEKLIWIFKHSNFVAIASTIVALLAGYQTFTKPSEKSELHKTTGSNYEKLRHNIEMLLTAEYNEREYKKNLKSIKLEWDSLDAINVAPRYFKQGKDMAKSFNKYPEELGFLPAQK